MRLYYKIKDMKKVFLLAFVLFAWSMVVNAQESDGKYIEVTGSSEIEVVPDEIHFLIQIKEYWQEEYTGKSNKEEDTLTEREKEILNLIAKGLKNKEISEKLFISEGTVKIHINNILRKLGVSDRTQAIIIAKEKDII